MSDECAGELPTVTGVLETFESRPDPFDHHEVRDALRLVTRKYGTSGMALPPMTDRILHALLVLSTLRSQEEKGEPQ